MLVALKLVDAPTLGIRRPVYCNSAWAASMGLPFNTYIVPTYCPTPTQVKLPVEPTESDAVKPRLVYSNNLNLLRPHTEAKVL